MIDAAALLGRISRWGLEGLTGDAHRRARLTNIIGWGAANTAVGYGAVFFLQNMLEHAGGTLDEICASERDMYDGRYNDRPYLIVCQQSQFDDSRAPEGKHTGYAYCHVPHGSTLDRTEAIEGQIERFAPGFRDRILARHSMNTEQFEAHNPNYKGGAITGGVADALQLFNRPVTRLDPYSTPNPRLFICSAATPPGGGVHGQGGYWAAQSALRRIGLAG